MTAARRIATVALLVGDHDEAADWYCRCLGFRKLDDTPLPDGKRWVTVAPPDAAGPALLLAKATGAEQAARIGDQTGGRVFLFLETDDFHRDHAAMLAAGVAFREAPRQESYGTVAVFADLYGNLWDLIEPRPTADSPETAR
jgi:catechol 2,3-dioxygenase-like lactoylglutathione lyase family enzyme